VYKINKYPYIKALGYYTLLFNLAYLILFFYSYLSINLPNKIMEQSFSKYSFLNEYFASVFILCLLFFSYKIYLGFNKRTYSSLAHWIFSGILIFLSVSYIARLILLNEYNFLWLDFLFEYFFENLLLLEILILILLVAKKPKADPQSTINKSFGILYLLRYIVSFILFLFIVSVGYNEIVKAILGFSFLLVLNLLPLFWINFYFIPFAKHVFNIQDANSLDAYCQLFGISKREKEILELISKGKSNKEISELLFISYSTVKNHIYNLFQKLNVSSRFELITLFNRDKRDD